MRTLLAILGACTLTQPAVSAPLAYRITKDGRAFCLLGTVHVGVALSALGPQTMKCLTAAKRVLVENTDGWDLIHEGVARYSDLRRDNRKLIPGPVWNRFSAYVKDKDLKHAFRFLRPEAALIIGFSIYNQALNERLEHIGAPAIEIPPIVLQHGEGELDDEIIEFAEDRDIAIESLDQKIGYDPYVAGVRCSFRSWRLSSITSVLRVASESQASAS